jgi:hypothetical protein
MWRRRSRKADEPVRGPASSLKPQPGAELGRLMAALTAAQFRALNGEADLLLAAPTRTQVAELAQLVGTAAAEGTTDIEALALLVDVLWLTYRAATLRAPFPDYGGPDLLACATWAAQLMPFAPERPPSLLRHELLGHGTNALDEFARTRDPQVLATAIELLRGAAALTPEDDPDREPARTRLAAATRLQAIAGAPAPATSNPTSNPGRHPVPLGQHPQLGRELGGVPHLEVGPEKP